jgi:hypothetical protein
MHPSKNNLKNNTAILKMIQGAFYVTIALFISVELVSAQKIQCSDFCNKNYDVKTNNCFCDAKCHVFRDCCTDMQIPRESTDLDFNTTSAKCDIELSNKRFLLSISSCAKWWYTATYKRNQCEISTLRPGELTLLHYIPVLSRQNNLSYANFYCAQCNIKNINLKSLLFFNISGYSGYKDKNAPADLNYIFSLIDYVINKMPDTNIQFRYLTPESGVLSRNCSPTVSSCAVMLTKS